MNKLTSWTNENIYLMATLKALCWNGFVAPNACMSSLTTSISFLLAFLFSFILGASASFSWYTHHLHMSKPSQSHLSWFVSKLFNLCFPFNVLICNPVLFVHCLFSRWCVTVWWEECRLAIQPIELGDSINPTVVKNPTNFLFTGLRATFTL